MWTTFVFDNLCWCNRNNIDQLYFFFDLLARAKKNALASIMFFLTTFKTIYFWNINEIIISKLFDFFAWNFVFTTSIFAIFTIFIFISIFVSIDRILHIVIIFDVKVFVKNVNFYNSFWIEFSNLFAFFKKKF